MTQFLDSLCSLVLCIPAFAFELAETSSKLFSCLHWSCYMWGFLWSFSYKCTCSTLLAPFCGRIVKVFSPLWFSQFTWIAVGNLSHFPESGAIFYDCSFSLDCILWSGFSSGTLLTTLTLTNTLMSTWRS